MINKYIDNDVHYLEFAIDTSELTIYTYVYKYALTNKLKVGNLVYDRYESVQRISLTPFLF